MEAGQLLAEWLGFGHAVRDIVELADVEMEVRICLKRPASDWFGAEVWCDRVNGRRRFELARQSQFAMMVG